MASAGSPTSQPGSAGSARRYRGPHAAAEAASSLEDLLSNIVTELTGNSPADDIALIGLRWLN